MAALRENPPKEVGGYKITAIRDYKKDIIKNLETGAETPTGLPSSNVLYFDMENNTWICIRPSGTEPKIKLYYGVVGTSLADADAKAAALADSVNEMINAF
jgi:phosphoglucomutase